MDKKKIDEIVDAILLHESSLKFCIKSKVEAIRITDLWNKQPVITTGTYGFTSIRKMVSGEMKLIVKINKDHYGNGEQIDVVLNKQAIQLAFEKDPVLFRRFMERYQEGLSSMHGKNLEKISELHQTLKKEIE